MAVDLIFDNKENFPEGVYIDIMNLINQYYRNQNNLDEITLFLRVNEKKIPTFVLEKLKLHFPEQNYFDIVLQFLSLIPYIF